MKINSIEDLKQWVQQGSRSVNIEIGELNKPDHFRVWAYDYELQAGQDIRELPAEIDIKQAARVSLFKEKEALEDRIRKIEGGNK